MRLCRVKLEIGNIGPERYRKERSQYSQPAEPLNKTPPEKNTFRQNLNISEQRYSRCGKPAHRFKIGIYKARSRSEIERHTTEKRQYYPCQAAYQHTLKKSQGPLDSISL